MSSEHSPARQKSLSPWAKRQASSAGLKRILRIPQTEQISGFCNMQLWRMERDGLFPKRFKLNPNGGKNGAVGHDYDEVMEWREERLASRDLDQEEVG